MRYWKKKVKIETVRVLRARQFVGGGEGGREMTIKRTTTFVFAYFTFMFLELVNVYLRSNMPYTICEEENRTLDKNRNEGKKEFCILLG